MSLNVPVLIFGIGQGVHTRHLHVGVTTETEKVSLPPEVAGAVKPVNHGNQERLVRKADKFAWLCNCKAVAGSCVIKDFARSTDACKESGELMRILDVFVVNSSLLIDSALRLMVLLVFPSAACWLIIVSSPFLIAV